jgi:hypothetical protein
MTSSSTPLPEILLVGCGGIGSALIEKLFSVLNQIEIKAEIHLMDSDVVEGRNLGHQRFVDNEVGQHKVEALADRLNRDSNTSTLVPHVLDLRKAEQLQGYDAIIIAVDRPGPRSLVQSSGVPWLDLRATDGGFMALTHETPESLVQLMTGEHEPKGCLSEGAVESRNIEYGFDMAAGFGAQWAFQCLRHLRGIQGILPRETIYYFVGGTRRFPSMEVSA